MYVNICVKLYVDTTVSVCDGLCAHTHRICRQLNKTEMELGYKMKFCLSPSLGSKKIILADIAG